jgi:hypothetical protein
MWRQGFDPRAVNVRFVFDKLAIGQGFLLTFRFSPVSIIPPLLCTHFHLHVALTKKTEGQSLETSPESNALSEIGKLWIEK